MRYLLAGVLVIAAAGACQADDGPIRIGMTGDQVGKALGIPSVCFFSAGTCSSFYFRADWLGGEEQWVVLLDNKSRVMEFTREYRPFAVRPPWLNRIRDALTPTAK